MSQIPIPMLAKALQEFDRSANNMIKSTKIKNLEGTIRDFAVASAVASAAAGVIPGAGGVLACIAQTGIVWSLYLQINKELGISVKKDTMKFIASAMATNLITNVGTYILAVLAGSLLSFIPGGGVVVCGMIGYVFIYTCAILYLQLLTKVMKAKGTIDIDNGEETSKIIKDVIKNADIKDIVNEGKANFKTVDLDEARKNPTCPVCHKNITVGQHFCSNCGACLSKID